MRSRRRDLIIRGKVDGWVMTYADMMSLLLTFFILIVSFSSLQQAKFKQAAQSLQEAFGILQHPESMIEFRNPVYPDIRDNSADAEVFYEMKELEQVIKENGLDQEVEVQLQDNGVLFRIQAPFLFSSGQAVLLDEPRKVLGELSLLFIKFPYQIRVEGHTDSLPINSIRFPSNWELSAARAVTVARYFQGLGLPPERIAATGYGEYNPIADNGTVQGREKNRRVEIFLQLDKRELPRGSELPFAVPLFKGKES
ncbi:MAG: OmpA family protein [Candidatus Krumholzibacteria bacterium]|nr:OmpA family protein [Candidatus Krumholzibacteria bacterium]